MLKPISCLIQSTLGVLLSSAQSQCSLGSGQLDHNDLDTGQIKQA